MSILHPRISTGTGKKTQEKKKHTKKTQNCLRKKKHRKKTQPFSYTCKKGCEFFVFEQ